MVPYVLVNIGTGNVILTDAHFKLTVGCQEWNLIKFENKIILLIFIRENQFENVTSKIVVILFRSQ